MAARLLVGLLATALLATAAPDAEARGRRASKGGTSYTYYGTVPVPSRGPGATAPGPTAQPPFQPCPVHAPCVTSGGRRYVTDPETGTSRFLPN